MTLLIAEIRLGRLQVRPVGLPLEANRRHGDQILPHAFTAKLAQQPLDDHLALGVAALAELVVPDPTFRVGDVHSGPVVVRERPPDRVVAVERDRVADAHVLHGATNVVDVPLERELRRVNPDHDQPLIRVALRPGPDVGKRAQPVDARVGPEIDQHDLPLQVRVGERRRVEPAGRAAEAGQVPLDGQRAGAADAAEQAQ